jgi:hypothetical protein
MVDRAARAAVFVNRRDTEPYVRWCGRTAEGNLRLLPDRPERTGGGRVPVCNRRSEQCSTSSNTGVFS